jgi:hypothetical protein
LELTGNDAAASAGSLVSAASGTFETVLAAAVGLPPALAVLVLVAELAGVPVFTGSLSAASGTPTDASKPNPGAIQRSPRHTSPSEQLMLQTGKHRPAAGGA